MAMPAKYFVVRDSIESVAEALDDALDGGLKLADESTLSVPEGFRGMDHYFTFWHDNVGGLVMASGDRDRPDYTHVVIISLPTILGRAKAIDLMTRMVEAVAGAREARYRGTSAVVEFV